MPVRPFFSFSPALSPGPPPILGAGPFHFPELELEPELLLPDETTDLAGTGFWMEPLDLVREAAKTFTLEVMFSGVFCLKTMVRVGVGVGLENGLLYLRLLPLVPNSLNELGGFGFVENEDTGFPVTTDVALG